MASRYDFMIDGKTFDEESGSFFPDPISFNYSDLVLTSIPIRDEMTLNKIRLFWKEAEAIYSKACWDDIALTLNGIAHKNFLKPGDDIYFPTEEDILNSFNIRR